MIIVIQGLREGAGSSFLAANLAQLLALPTALNPATEMMHAPSGEALDGAAVALIDADPGTGTFLTYWGRGPEVPSLGWVKAALSHEGLERVVIRPSTGFPLLFPMGDLHQASELTDETVDQAMAQLAAYLRILSIEHVVVDAGRLTSTWAARWRAVADQVLTVVNPDHHALINLLHYTPLANERFVLNAVVPGAASAQRVMAFLDTQPHLASHRLSTVIPLDESVRESGFRLERLVLSDPQAAAAEAVRELTRDLVA